VSVGRRAALAALALAALLAGCAAPAPLSSASPGAGTPVAGRPDASDLPVARQLAGVPFVAQPDWQCGPAALAIAMTASGHPVPVATLAADAFVPGLKGTLQAEMLAASRRQRLLATVLPPEFDALRREIADGRPVIVLQNLGLAALPRWHYAVLIGYDLEAAQVTLHSGDEPQMRMGRGVFERTWARSGRWAMTVTAPAVLPASADEPRSVQAAIGLERVDAAAAVQAWEAIARRWPASRLAPFGLANLRLAQGDARAAADGFRAALAVDPAFADAWNNLARALDMLGEGAAARAAADRAVAIGGPREALYRETRAELTR
jgi:tetratricopeptide (TPR) repeat protein